jgi:hypothetical protein
MVKSFPIEILLSTLSLFFNLYSILITDLLYRFLMSCSLKPLESNRTNAVDSEELVHSCAYLHAV